jgi:hypothetical protein
MIIMRQKYDRLDPKPVMTCGCVANAIMAIGGEDYHACVIHGTTDIMDTPSLTGRKARCDYCHKTVDSQVSLPFFRYQQNNDEDRYYCGCRGWD